MNTLPEQTTPSAPQLGFAMRVGVAVAGLALDFWADGKEWPLAGLIQHKAKNDRVSAAIKRPVTKKDETVDEALEPQPIEISEWNPDRVQVIERLWGEGRALPGDETYLDSLTSQLGLNHESSVLDLSAGFGDMARFIAERYKTYVTGLEQDQFLAARGMIMSIAAGKSKQASVTPYDPNIYEAARKYDCVIAREIFYKIIGKEKFFQVVNSSIKSGGGHLVFTDYVVEAAARSKPAVVKWLEFERNAVPMSLIEIVKTWKQAGYEVRVMEDQTQLYKTIILKRLADFVAFADRHKIGLASQMAIAQEIKPWTKRLAAFQQGLKYYRFHAIKR
ncbi:MAG: methyltransferase domain-containing protein [Proteobacteria bacterium]|jgi:cyclopropane fatty-acyl-phospholipid synthase-like methyltransferase|nr:methyltransferase domain-containing protein [Alphaproteobacteria bacterium]NCC03345.1 methyltransferase domain-containing protein [Pseudomonadota bacterium]